MKSIAVAALAAATVLSATAFAQGKFRCGILSCQTPAELGLSFGVCRLQTGGDPAGILFFENEKGEVVEKDSNPYKADPIAHLKIHEIADREKRCMKECTCLEMDPNDDHLITWTWTRPITDCLIKN